MKRERWRGRQVGYDIDGVLANINKVAVCHLNQSLGTKYRHDDVAHWDWIYEKSLETALGKGMNDSEARKLAESNRAIYFDSEAHRQCEPYRLMPLTMMWVEKLQIPHFFITTRNPENKQATLEWILSNFPRELADRLKIRDQKGIGPDIFKCDEARRLRIGMFFEDSGQTATVMRANGLRVALVTRPWNKDFTDFDRERVGNGAVGIFLRTVRFAATGL